MAAVQTAAATVGKHIQNGMEGHAIPQYSLYYQPASEIQFAVSGTVHLDGDTSGACHLRGQGLMYEDVDRNPFCESLYAPYYPDALPTDLFYRLELDYERKPGQRVKRHIIISSEVRLSLALAARDVATARSILEEQVAADAVRRQQREQQHQLGDFFSAGNYVEIDPTTEAMRFRHDVPLSYKEHQFLLLNVQDTHKVYLCIYKYATPASAYTIELRYTHENKTTGHCTSIMTFSFPLPLYEKFSGQASFFNRAEQAYHNHIARTSVPNVISTELDDRFQDFLELAGQSPFSRPSPIRPFHHHQPSQQSQPSTSAAALASGPAMGVATIRPYSATENEREYMLSLSSEATKRRGKSGGSGRQKKSKHAVPSSSTSFM